MQHAAARVAARAAARVAARVAGARIGVDGRAPQTGVEARSAQRGVGEELRARAALKRVEVGTGPDSIVACGVVTFFAFSGNSAKLNVREIKRIANIIYSGTPALY